MSKSLISSLAWMLPLVGLFMFSQSACQSSAKSVRQAEIAQVDSMLMVVDYLEEKMAEVDMQRLEQDFPQVDRDMEVIIANLPPLGDNKQYWIREINQINRVHSAYKKWQEEGPSLMQNLQKSEQQLQNLRKSLAAGQLNNAEVERYLAEEGEALTLVHFKIRKRQPEAVAALSIWEERRAHFDSLAQAVQP